MQQTGKCGYWPSYPAELCPVLYQVVFYNIDIKNQGSGISTNCLNTVFSTMLFGELEHPANTASRFLIFLHWLLLRSYTCLCLPNNVSLMINCHCGKPAFTAFFWALTYCSILGHFLSFKNLFILNTVICLQVTLYIGSVLARKFENKVFALYPDWKPSLVEEF